MADDGSINVSQLNDIYGEIFSKNTVADKSFTSEDIHDDYLFVQDVLPGNITVINNNNQVVLLQQKQKIQNSICIGVNINFTDINVQGVWKIRYNRGMRGQKGTFTVDDPPSEDLLKYTLLFS